MPLEIDKQTESGRITYKPIVAKVMAYSKYNKTQFALEGIDDFWQLDKGILDTKPELGAAPPLGTVALWTLQTNPKRGENAKPGSLYRDVIKVQAVPADYVAPAQAAPAPTPPATAEDAGYDDYANKVRSGRTHGMIGPDDRVPPSYEYPRVWQERENRLKEASIERNSVMQTDGTLIAALSALKTRTDKQDRLLSEAIMRYSQLANELARLAPPAPAAEADKDEVTDKDGEQIKW